MKKFLTSGLILGLMVSPAIADDTLYKNDIAGSCTVGILGGTGEGNATNSFMAQYTPNDYEVAPGSYLPARAITGTTCPANSYCPGATYTFSETDDQGINACPDGFTLSDAGASNENDCYHNCTASDIQNGEKVATIKGGTVTAGGTNTCDATCTTGYTFKAASGGTNPLSGIDTSINGSNHNGDISDMTWYTTFGYGTVDGEALCSITSGRTDTAGNPDETGDGVSCWCKLTGYTPIGGSLQSLSSSWVFAYDRDDADDCVNRCALGCAARTWNFSSFRSVLFGSVGGTNEPPACVANEITLTWNPANGNAASTNTCTYDGDITLPTAPTKVGYTFSGWKLVTPSAQ